MVIFLVNNKKMSNFNDSKIQLEKNYAKRKISLCSLLVKVGLLYSFSQAAHGVVSRRSLNEAYQMKSSLIPFTLLH